MITQIFGVNIAVKDLDAAVQKYTAMLGVEPQMLDEDYFAFPNLRGAAYHLGSTVLHLITSKTDDTSVAKFLESKGEGLFLLSLESDNVPEDVDRIKAAGGTFVLKENASGDFGEVNFLHPKSSNGVQIEVYKPNRK